MCVFFLNTLMKLKISEGLKDVLSPKRRTNIKDNLSLTSNFGHSYGQGSGQGSLVDRILAFAKKISGKSWKILAWIAASGTQTCLHPQCSAVIATRPRKLHDTFLPLPMTFQ